MSHPAPLVACRDAHEDELPRNAKALLKAASAADWRVRATYAKGTALDPKAEPSKVVESVVVRLRRTPLAAVAWWWDGKFIGAYVWSLYTSPRSVGAREVSAFVKAAA
jgi:hypothetical protein